jgi:ankyrin repeat protein
MSYAVHGEPVPKRQRTEGPKKVQSANNLPALDKVSRLATLWQLNAVQPLVPQLKFGQVVREVRQWLGYGWFQLAHCSKAFLGARDFSGKINKLYCDQLKVQYRHALTVRGLTVPEQLPEKLLLEAGKLLKDIEGRDNLGETALIRAAQRGEVEKVNELIDLGVDLEKRSWVGTTPLMEAVEEGRIPVVKILIQSRADTNTEDVRNRSVLHIAAHNLKLLRLLLELGVDPNGCGARVRTPLMQAVSENRPMAVGLLLQAKAQVNCVTTTGETALMVAATEKRAEPMILLLAAKADPNLGHGDGITPLVMAARRGWVEGVQTLLEAGANASSLTSDGGTTLVHSPLFDAGQQYQQILTLVKAHLAP